MRGYLGMLLLAEVEEAAEVAGGCSSNDSGDGVHVNQSYVFTSHSIRVATEEKDVTFRVPVCRCVLCHCCS